MLPRLKKKSDKAGQPAHQRWHPNFRNFERLPDVKVVRTAFFVNFVSIVVATAAFLLFAYNEYKLYTLTSAIADHNNQIERSKADSDAAVKAFRQFQDQEKRITEVSKFAAAPFQPTELISEIARTLPDSFYLYYVETRDTGVLVRGSIVSNADSAAALLSAQVERLKNDPWFSKRFPTVRTTNVNRDPASGQLVFELSLDFPAAPKPAKKK